MRPHPTATRRGFTLIEVLVAAGLCMLIMALLAEAFGSGASTFSLLKSTGELDGRLKVAQAILRNDLQQPHLESDTGEPVKVSQLRYDRLGSPERFARPQPFGFFRIAQDQVPVSPGLPATPFPWGPPPATTPQLLIGAGTFPVTYPEGQDADGIPATRAMSHTLQMAVRLPANRSDRVATARMPQPGPGGFTAAELTAFGSAQSLSLANIDSNTAARFTSQWAEVSYFLKASPTGSTASGLPLYALYRRVRTLLPKGAPTNIDWQPFAGSNTDATVGSTYAPGLSFHLGPPASPMSTTPTFPLNTAATITNPDNRTGGRLVNRGSSATDPHDQLVPVGTPVSPPPTPQLAVTGEDILLSNVLSFEVRVAWEGGNQPVRMTSLATSAGTPAPSYDESPFTDLPSYATDGTSGNPNYVRTDITANTPIAATLGRTPPASPSASPFPALRVYDTWTAAGTWDQPSIVIPPAMMGGPPTLLPNEQFVPLPIRLKAVQIKIRLYDPKNKLTRQMTLVQDL